MRNSHILLRFYLTMRNTLTIPFVKNNSVKDAERIVVSAICPERPYMCVTSSGESAARQGVRWDQQGGDVKRRVWESLWNFARGARKRRARPPACERRKIRAYLAHDLRSSYGNASRVDRPFRIIICLFSLRLFLFIISTDKRSVKLEHRYWSKLPR